MFFGHTRGDSRHSFIEVVDARGDHRSDSKNTQSQGHVDGRRRSGASVPGVDGEDLDEPQAARQAGGGSVMVAPHTGQGSGVTTPGPNDFGSARDLLFEPPRDSSFLRIVVHLGILVGIFHRILRLMQGEGTVGKRKR